MGETKRRLSGAALALVLSAAAAVAQDGPGVDVISSDWKYAGYVRAETIKEYEPLPSRGGAGSYTIARKTIYVFKYTAKAVLKNTGAKAVRAVSWDYVFTNKESGKEVKRLRFQSKQEIPPGGTATLTKELGLDPKEDTREMSRGKQGVEVTKIEYADGSVWRKQ